MNQLEAIIDYSNPRTGFDPSYMRVWICSDCMNDILDDEEQATQLDLGIIKIEQDQAKCQIIGYIEGHEYHD